MTSDWEAERQRVAAAIAAAEWRIAQQRKLVEKLAAGRQPSEEAEKALQLMLIVLETMRQHEIVIRRQLPQKSRH